MLFATIEEAIKQLKAKKMVIIVDDEQRENEGDLAMAIDHVNPEAINFMIKEGRGILCVALHGSRLDQLNIPLMVDKNNTSPLGTAFTISVDHRDTTTGVSAHERSATIKALMDENASSYDFKRLGHVFPLRYQEGGILVRAGHTEAIVDLTRIAGLYPAGVICEIIKDDGTMARMPDLQRMSKKFNIPIVRISDLIIYRNQFEKLITKVGSARLPTQYGEFNAITYTSTGDPGEHIALVKGKWKRNDKILVRVHSECLTGEAFGSLRCDCGEQLSKSLQIIAEEGRGVLVYIRQEGRGIGLHNKVKAYSLQDEGFDTIEANEKLGFSSDLRHYGIGAQILVDLGVKKMKILTNNPKKVTVIQGWGLEIAEMVSIQGSENPENSEYLETKRIRMGHKILKEKKKS